MWKTDTNKALTWIRRNVCVDRVPLERVEWWYIDPIQSNSFHSYHVASWPMLKTLKKNIYRIKIYRWWLLKRKCGPPPGGKWIKVSWELNFVKNSPKALTNLFELFHVIIFASLSLVLCFVYLACIVSSHVEIFIASLSTKIVQCKGGFLYSSLYVWHNSKKMKKTPV